MCAMPNPTATETESWNDINFDDPELQSLLDDPTPKHDDNAGLRKEAQNEGFDNNVGDTWIYPSNLPTRTYQLSIAQAALFRNTLAVLPTGLGKTFIAAVVMYNFYRWYPRGKVIFMAPTRPLVAQQIDACQRIMPFPNSDTFELTGKLPRAKRTEIWRSKRVFFATPQVLQSDISGDAKSDFPFKHVKLLVFDEAHKAKGRYAYTEVAHAVHAENPYFRVLALSATPGRTNEDVAAVVRNLFISHLEVRWDKSIDVMPYVHARTMRKIVVPLSDDIKAAREELLQIIDPYLRQLIEADVLRGSLANINRNFLLYEQKRFRERSQRHEQQSSIASNFSICISLYHALELLERHGTRAFLNNFEADEEGRAKFVVNINPRLRDLVEHLRTEVGANPFDVSAHTMTNGQIPPMPDNLDFGHPKFEHARSCLLKHFEEHPESRAIVFCEYRESVMLIYRLLLQHVPLLKPRCFVGQGGNTGSLRALTQKQQIQIMADFRAGTSNILVATSVGEEGIDVGEVELIVCFDISTANPTRFIQRIGRTGRKKHGNVVMLVTEGREQQLLQDVLANKDQINKKLKNSSVVQLALYKHAPRLVPTEFNPQCVHTFLKPPADEQPQATTKINKKKKQPNAKTKKTEPEVKSSQDLRKFFKKKPIGLNTEELAAYDIEEPQTQLPGRSTQEHCRNKIKHFFKELDVSAINVSISSPKTPKPAKRRDSETQPTAPLEAIHQHQIDPVRLSYLNKLLKSTKPLVPVTKRLDDFEEQLKSPIVRPEARLLMLQMKPEFVRKVYEDMQILENLEYEADDTMSTEEKIIRENYKVVESTMGDKVAIKAFLEDVEYQNYKRKCALYEKDYLYDNNSEDEEDEDAKFERSVEKIFDGLDEQGINCDNYDYIQEEVKKTQVYREFMAKRNASTIGESLVFETMLEEHIAPTLHDTDFSITESKYCSQWEEFAKRELPNKSTPVQRARIAELQADRGNCAMRMYKLEERAKGVENQEGRVEEDSKGNIDNVVTVEDDVNDVNAAVNGAVNDVGNDINDEDDDVIFIPHKKVSEIVLTDDSDSEHKGNTAELTKCSANIAEFWNESTPDDLELIMASTNLEINVQMAQESTPQKTNSAEESAKPESPNLAEDALTELDMDLDMFLEPFPAEALCSTANNSKFPPTIKKSPKMYDISETCLPLEQNSPPPKPANATECFILNTNEQQATSITSNSPRLRENLDYNNLCLPNVQMTRHSPDLFDVPASPAKKPKIVPNPIENNIKNNTNTKPSLAAKLAAKVAVRSNTVCGAPLQRTTSPKSSPGMKPTATVSLLSPERLNKLMPPKYIKSPSIFDLYLKKMRHKQKLEKSPLARKSAAKTSRIPPQNEHVESPIVRKRIASKRKIFDSDAEDEQEANGLVPLADALSETDCEEIEATQEQRCTFASRRASAPRSALAPQRKRRRLCDFIAHEAAVSGSDHSTDEDETSFGAYAQDSLVVSDDEVEQDAATTSHMQACYLQSLKSPVQSRGAFKIPAFRVYNDQADIYSQAVPVENSQYEQDSFVVSEEDISKIKTNKTLCPLERAERILKERRRAKRKFGVVAVVNSGKPARSKILRIADSSDEDANEFR